MWDSRPRLSGLLTAEGGCPTKEKLLNLIFRGTLVGLDPDSLELAGAAVVVSRQIPKNATKGGGMENLQERSPSGTG